MCKQIIYRNSCAHIFWDSYFDKFSFFWKQIVFRFSNNKSNIRTDSYLSENIEGHNILHFSFDDTILLFKVITENEYESDFQNSTLGWSNYLHIKASLNNPCCSQ